MAQRKYENKFIANLHFVIDLIAAVSIWRGAWILLDAYFFPMDSTKSALLGIFIGVIVLLVDDFLLDELRERSNH